MTNTDKVITITVAGGRLEQVDSYVYLGSKVRNCRLYRWGEVKDGYGHDGDGQVDENMEK